MSVAPELPPLATLGFETAISPADWMARGKPPDLYFLRGYEALRFIDRAVWLAGTDPGRILDFGCGHGNIARMLKAHYAQSTIWGQDVDPAWLAWCREHLGIETIRSADRIAEVEVPEGAYDLIWVGSVFTHIPPAAFDHLLATLARGLAPGGVLIFTTAGRLVREGFDVDGEFALTRDDAVRAVEGYDGRGYGFAPYTGGRYQDWGRAMVAFDVVLSKIAANRMRPVLFEGGGWGRRQDVYAIIQDESRRQPCRHPSAGT